MVLVIAEIGVNWDGNFETAKNMMKNAKSSGCDAVKFQSFNEEIIKNHRRQANLLKDELLQTALRKRKSGSNPDLVVEELADKLTNKLLHKTLENLKNPSSLKTDSHEIVEKDKTNPSKIDN